MVDALLVHYKARVRLMSYLPSMVDAQLVYYKSRVRLMSYRPNMVDAHLAHYKSRVRLMSYGYIRVKTVALSLMALSKDQTMALSLLTLP